MSDIITEKCLGIRANGALLMIVQESVFINSQEELCVMRQQIYIFNITEWLKMKLISQLGENFNINE